MHFAEPRERAEGPERQPVDTKDIEKHKPPYRLPYDEIRKRNTIGNPCVRPIARVGHRMNLETQVMRG